MEFINRIELKGRVGTVRANTVNNSRVVNFSLVTEHLYKTRDGNAASESTWFNVAAWEGKDILDMHKIEKGAVVHLTGRIRSSRFVGSDGADKHLYEVQASKLRVIGKEEENCG